MMVFSLVDGMVMVLVTMFSLVEGMVTVFSLVTGMVLVFSLVEGMATVVFSLITTWVSWVCRVIKVGSVFTS